MTGCVRVPVIDDAVKDEVNNSVKELMAAPPPP